MINIEIHNCAEIASSRNFLADLVPEPLLTAWVEKAVAKQLQEKLAAEGVEAVVSISSD